MIAIQDQQNLLIKIARKISRPVTTYAIGGTAMMFWGLKDSTVDIDLVFTQESERKEFKRAAKSLGHPDMDSTIVYGKRENIPEMIQLPEARIDLFLNDVINFRFSENMQARAKEIHQFDINLFIKPADIHDIMLMKCATNRLKDELDILAIIKNSKIDWKILVQEAQHQLSLGKEQAILSLGTLLESLKDKNKAEVPQSVLDELWNILKKQVESRKQVKDKTRK